MHYVACSLLFTPLHPVNKSLVCSLCRCPLSDKAVFYIVRLLSVPFSVSYPPKHRRICVLRFAPCAPPLIVVVIMTGMFAVRRPFVGSLLRFPSVYEIARLINVPVMRHRRVGIGNDNRWFNEVKAFAHEFGQRFFQVVLSAQSIEFYNVFFELFSANPLAKRVACRHPERATGFKLSVVVKPTERFCYLRFPSAVMSRQQEVDCLFIRYLLCSHNNLLSAISQYSFEISKPK